MPETQKDPGDWTTVPSGAGSDPGDWATVTEAHPEKLDPGFFSLLGSYGKGVLGPMAHPIDTAKAVIQDRLANPKTSLLEAAYPLTVPTIEGIKALKSLWSGGVGAVQKAQEGLQEGDAGKIAEALGSGVGIGANLAAPFAKGVFRAPAVAEAPVAGAGAAGADVGGVEPPSPRTPPAAPAAPTTPKTPPPTIEDQFSQVAPKGKGFSWNDLQASSPGSLESQFLSTPSRSLQWGDITQMAPEEKTAVAATEDALGRLQAKRLAAYEAEGPPEAMTAEENDPKDPAARLENYTDHATGLPNRFGFYRETQREPYEIGKRTQVPLNLGDLGATSLQGLASQNKALRYMAGFAAKIAEAHGGTVGRTDFQTFTFDIPKENLAAFTQDLDRQLSEGRYTYVPEGGSPVEIPLKGAAHGANAETPGGPTPDLGPGWPRGFTRSQIFTDRSLGDQPRGVGDTAQPPGGAQGGEGQGPTVPLPSGPRGTNPAPVAVPQNLVESLARIFRARAGTPRAAAAEDAARFMLERGQGPVLSMKKLGESAGQEIEDLAAQRAPLLKDRETLGVTPHNLQATIDRIRQEETLGGSAKPEDVIPSGAPRYHEASAWADTVDKAMRPDGTIPEGTMGQLVDSMRETIKARKRFGKEPADTLSQLYASSLNDLRTAQGPEIASIYNRMHHLLQIQSLAETLPGTPRPNMLSPENVALMSAAHGMKIPFWKTALGIKAFNALKQSAFFQSLSPTARMALMRASMNGDFLQAARITGGVAGAGSYAPTEEK